MAKVALNPVFTRLSGRFGGMVLRTCNGRTYACRPPTARQRQPTAAQQGQRHRFRAAICYAKHVLADPHRAAFYHALATEKLKAFAIAVRDCLQAPAVDEIALGLFDGLAGDEIVITATDDCEVASVDVVIKDMTGKTLAAGPAENRADDTWVYTAKSDLPAGEPVTIEVTAKDRPQNATTRSVPWAPSATSWLPAHRRAIEAATPTHPRLIT